MVPWILIFIIIILILLGIGVLIATIKGKDKKRKTDYYNFFVIGVTWLLFGIVFQIYVLWMLGIIFTISGAVHYKEWDKSKSKWKNLSKSQRKAKIWVIGIGLLFLVIGGVLYWLVKLGVVG